MGNEAQKKSILEENENGAEMSRFKDTDIHEAPSDPVMTNAPNFPLVTFESLKVFEFEVSTVSSSQPVKALPYFPDMLTALPALERVTLPTVSFNNSPYIDQLVNKISEIPTLCPHLQEIRTRDYPNEWSNLLKFLRDRKRASLLSDPTFRPIHTLHFPITPHRSIVEQLQDAMLGKVSIKSFPALYPWPLLRYLTSMRIVSSLGEVTTVDSDEETRSQVQDEDEQIAANRPSSTVLDMPSTPTSPEPTPSLFLVPPAFIPLHDVLKSEEPAGVQAQEEEDTTGNADEEKQCEEESGRSENEDEALPCFCCHKAGLVAGCRRVFWRQGILSMLNVLSGDVLCPRWDRVMQGKSKFEAIGVPC